MSTRRATFLANHVLVLNEKPMNGPSGLRALASSLKIKGVKGKSKYDLVTEVATIFADEEETKAVEADVERDQLALLARRASEEQDAKAQDVVASSSRNANATIRPEGESVESLVDSVWTALTKKGGISTNDLAAMVILGTPSLTSGAVVSRLNTQRNNGNVVSHNVVDEKNRPIAFWNAGKSWTKEEMAKSFLKIKPAKVAKLGAFRIEDENGNVTTG